MPLLKNIQSFYAAIINHLYEGFILTDIFEFLWPRFKTLRLAENLRLNGNLDEVKLKRLPISRYYRHYFLNALVVIPFGFYILIFIFRPESMHPNFLHYAAFILSITMIYLVLRDDYKEEWRYVSLLTLGTRVRGSIVSRTIREVGNAVDVQVAFLKDPQTSILANAFITHGIAANYHGQPGDEVLIAYDSSDVRKCQIVIEETEVFNLRKESS